MLVVKLGGAGGLDSMTAVAVEVAELSASGCRVVVAHGGSDAVNRLERALGRSPRALVSPAGVESRHTDRPALESLTMAIPGLVNTGLVARLNALGCPAVGLSGVDGAVVLARWKGVVRTRMDNRTVLVRDDLSGRITGVNGDLLRRLMDGGYVPVVSPPALDPEHGPVNVDGDRLAAALAAAVDAGRLVLLTNVPGLLRDPGDPASLVQEVAPEAMEEANRMAHGRMKLKLIAAREALAGGVDEVVIADGRRPGALRAALAGAGTVLRGRCAPRAL